MSLTRTLFRCPTYYLETQSTSQARVLQAVLHLNMFTLQNGPLTRAEKSRCDILLKRGRRSHRLVMPCNEQ